MNTKRMMSMVLGAAMTLTMVNPVLAVGAQKAAAPAPAVEILADLNGNKILDNLDAMLANASANDRFNVLVQFNGPANDMAYTRVNQTVGAVNYTAKWDLALQGFAANLSKAQILALANSPFIAQVDAEVTYHATLDTATLYTGVQQARTDYGVNGDRDGNSATYSSTDVVVAILDTGIDAGHVDLDGGKVIGWNDQINGQASPYDDHGHGSHVSGIVAGEGQGNAAYRGVAPGAALVGIKVLNSAGSGTNTQIINGINWMISNKATYGIKVANMSLGSTGCSNGTDTLSAAVNNAVNNGIVMAVAAGNSGPAKCTIGAPGAAANAVTVGAAYDIGELGWALAEFSSRGPTADGRIKPDIVTPGRYINSVAKGTVNGYTVMSGTSMATPFMAGVIALMFDCNYGQTDAGIKSIIYAAGNVQDRGAVGKDVDWGYGLNLSYNAVKQACGGAGSYDDGQGYNVVNDSLTTSGSSKSYTITVTTTSRPISLDLIMTNWSSSTNPDFDLFLYNPSGTQVASSEGTTRQELIRYTPLVTGTYTVKVLSYTGTGAFNLDLSWQ